jgi:GrpB-like predicted nucleotidyltransferase (UPF0157 family)
MSQPHLVELLPHDPSWAQQAAHEAFRWQQALGGRLLRVHHIGSTAIPGIVAKPVLDLIPEFADLAVLDESRGTIEALGYAWWGEYGLPGRRYCTLSEPQSGRRLVHAHCYAHGAAHGPAEIERHLAFRDYLIAHAEIAQEYAAEKARCRALHGDDSSAYSQAKDAWIRPVQKTALGWFCNRPSAEG